MYLYVELWKARPAWLALPIEDRKAWFDQLLGQLQEQLKAGVEPIGFAATDGDTPLGAGYDLFAAWRMPSKEVAEGFEKFVEDAGWHNYFEQVNMRGQMLDLEGFVSAHVNAQSTQQAEAG